MLRFKDIMTTEIVYYDKEYRDECREFCETRSIRYLPAIHDNRAAYEFLSKQGKFKQFALYDEHCVHPEENIFCEDIADRFRHQEILFVKENCYLYGVVHFCDYNRQIVYKNIYDQLYQLERSLIFLITEYAGKSVNELEEFLKRSHFSDNNAKLLDREELGNAKITLKEIMEFASNIDLLRIRHINRITALRNKIAHSNDLVEKKSYGVGKLEYEFSTFRKMIESKRALDVAIKQVTNRLYFMKAISEDNFQLRPALHKNVFG